MRPALPALPALLALLPACMDYGMQKSSGHPEHYPPVTGDDIVTDTLPGDDGGGGGDDDDDDDDDGGSGLDDGGDGWGDRIDAGVTGRVCDPSGGSWVAGADVWVDVDHEGDGVVDETFSAITDGDGRYLIEGVTQDGPTLIQIQKGSFTTAVTAELAFGEIVEVPEPSCLDRDTVKIAVVTGIYDDIGSTLDALTVPYDEYDGISGTAYISFLSDPAALGAYDIVFLNCGISWDWIARQSDVAAALQAYVAGGGSLYASDWAYWFVEATDPGMVNFHADDAVLFDAFEGAPGSLAGTVVDPHMQALLGTTTADLYFDYDAWAVPTGTRGGVDTLVIGAPTIMSTGAAVPGSPLAVRYDAAPGKILYTAFHTHAQATLDMETMLLEIILSL